MIIRDKDSEHYRKITHEKWKVATPEITLEQSLHCESILLEFVNGKKEEASALGEINIYLTINGLIKPLS
tara:strand:- start:5972 stop:6181 length:210 start_codon:yes stop_codon:yes gene_type:complete